MSSQIDVVDKPDVTRWLRVAAICHIDKPRRCNCGRVDGVIPKASGSQRSFRAPEGKEQPSQLVP